MGNEYEASGAITSYTYDANGNKLTQKDANGHVWSFQYDTLNRLVKETDPLNRSTSYTYDALGNLKTKTDAKGQTLTYAYNVRRLTSITYPNTATDTFTWDALGRRTGMSNASVAFTYAYDALNRVTAVTNTTYNLSAQYQYDAAGNRTKMTTPLAATTYAYDAKNRLASITDSLMGTFRFSWDAMDRRTALAYPNGQTTSYAYDSAYRITAIATKGPAGLVTDAWSYQYDAVGNRLSRTDINGALDSYTYDNVYRLTQATYGDGARESFTYDAVGNRLTANAGALTTYSYDAANQMLSAGNDTFTYDANGNETAKTTRNGTTTLTYDVNNRLTALTGPDGNETSVYAPDETRVRVNGPASNGDSPVLSDLQGNPVDDFTSFRTHRVYGPGVDEVLGEQGHIGSVLQFSRYLHHDALGSVNAATAPDGSLAWTRTYRVFGQMTTTPPSGDPQYSRLGFTGREIAAGSLMEYRSRYYDTTYGRFSQQDSYKGNTNAPPSLQRYIYVENNPINYVDPSGALMLSPSDIFFAAADTAAEIMVYCALAGLASTYYFKPIGQVLAAIILAGAILVQTIRSLIGAALVSRGRNALVDMPFMAFLWFMWTAIAVAAYFGGAALIESLAKSKTASAWAILAYVAYASAVVLVEAGIDSIQTMMVDDRNVDPTHGTNDDADLYMKGVVNAELWVL